MSKSIKRILSVFLCAALLFGALPLAAVQAADPTSGTCGANLTWSYNTSTKTLTISGTGEMNNYDVDYYNGTYVTTAPWRPYFNTIQTLVINSGVTSIGEYAFEGCTGLTSVTIPNSVTSIGNYAFEGCTGLTSVTIPDSVTSIGRGVLYNTAYYNDSANWENSVLYIGNHLIEAQESVSGAYEIKPGTKCIGDWAFEYCTGLTSVTIPNSVTSIGYEAFSNCTGLTSVTIPDSVTSIGDYAFDGCTGLTSVTIPGSVTSIGDDVFYLVANVVYHGSASGSPWGARAVNGYVEGSLVYADSTKTALLACPSSYQGEIAIPDSVTSIGYYAFYNCTGLTSVIIPDSVTSIGNFAFYDCTGLTSVTIPDSVTSIDYSAFRECTGLTSVTIPNSVTSIGDEAFEDCTSLTSVTIPDSVTSIGNGAFEGCTGLTSVTIPDSVTSIGDSAFFGCTGLTSVTIGNSVTRIGYGAFAYCTGLTSVTIPDSVTSIVGLVFYECTGLTSVTIPNSVTSIGNEAFYGCTGLTSVTIGNSVTSIGWDAFNNTAYYNDSANWLNNVLYIGNHLIKAKESVSGAYEIKPGTKCIGSEAFYRCTGLTSVTIPDSVTSIGDSAFSNCTGLTSVTIPDSVTSIGGSAFEDCTGLTSVTIGNSVTIIDMYAFDGCDKLSDVYYTGSKAQWDRITIEEYNDPLKNATIHFNSGKPMVKSVSVSDVTMNYKDSVTLKPTITADPGTEYTVKYESSNPKVATVDANGKVTGAKRGSATITVTVTDGQGNTVKDTCTVTVKYTVLQWIIIILLFGWLWY